MKFDEACPACRALAFDSAGLFAVRGAIPQGSPSPPMASVATGSALTAAPPGGWFVASSPPCPTGPPGHRVVSARGQISMSSAARRRDWIQRELTDR